MSDIPMFAPKFSLNGIIVPGRVVSIYDGDTIKVVMSPINNEFYTWTCRLYGIDCPEIKSEIELDRERAVKARDFLRNHILNKIVEVHCRNFDKYGRVLSQIIYKGKDMSQELLKKGYANVYKIEMPVEF